MLLKFRHIRVIFFPLRRSHKLTSLRLFHLPDALERSAFPKVHSFAALPDSKVAPTVSRSCMLCVSSLVFSYSAGTNMVRPSTYKAKHFVGLQHFISSQETYHEYFIAHQQQIVLSSRYTSLDFRGHSIYTAVNSSFGSFLPRQFGFTT